MIPSVNICVLFLVCKPMITWSLLDEALLPFFNGCVLLFANMIMHWQLFFVSLVLKYENISNFIHRSFKGISVHFSPRNLFSWKQYVDAALSQSNCWKLTKNSYNLLLDLLHGKNLHFYLWFFCYIPCDFFAGSIM